MLEASQLEGGASIIAIASMTAFFGSLWTPGYGPAKAGLVQMVKTLGHSWGGAGIRANAVAAGPHAHQPDRCGHRQPAGPQGADLGPPRPQARRLCG